MPRVIFVLAGLGLVAGAMAMEGHILGFINAPSLLIVIGGGALFSMGQHGASAVFQALGAGQAPDSVGGLKQQVCVLRSLRDALCGSAAVGFLVGLVHMLHNLSDPSAIGPAVAVALLTTLYAVLLSELVVAPRIHATVARCHALAGPDGDESDQGVGGARAVTTLAVVLVSQLGLFGAILASIG